MHHRASLTMHLPISEQGHRRLTLELEIDAFTTLSADVAFRERIWRANRNQVIRERLNGTFD